MSSTLLFALTFSMGCIFFITPAWASNPPNQSNQPNKELARVKDRSIYEKDLSSVLVDLTEGQKDAILRDPNSRRQMLQGLIDQEVLVIQAENLKIEDEPEFKETLARVRKQLLVRRLLQKMVVSQISKEKAKHYFEAHKDQYNTDRVKVQHILLSTEENAKRIYNLAKEPHADFQELAEKYSIDPSAKNNRGEIGWINRDQLAAEFTKAAFSGSAGEVMSPVKTMYGYDVIKIIQKKLGEPREFDEVQMKVNNDLTEELARNLTEQAKKPLSIVVN